MRRVDWRELSASGFPVPEEPSLSELATELTEMLGDPDVVVRDTALTTLTAWLDRGVFDDLLPGLGDGMVAGLSPSASPGRRACSAVVLGRCIARDDAERRVPAEQVLAWGDRLLTWWLAETDDDATTCGADAVTALARHPACSRAELLVLLDVIGERATGVRDNDTADALALSALAVLRRGLVPCDTVETALDRVEDAAAYLRSLYLHLGLSPQPPPDRADLLLVVVDRLRALHPALNPALRSPE